MASSSHEYAGVKVFLAADVFECLKNVPFNPAVAARFIDFYNHTMQYQSTLAFLADPPEGYQQPAVNVQQGLAEIKANITAGRYTSQYVFEAELQLLINSIHDNHVALDAGILSAFSFASPYGIVSASPDGREEPQVYLADDVASSRYGDWKPTPITEINGQNVVEFLSTYAQLNSEGYLEPHADWNALMEHPASDIQGSINTFQQAIFYPGDGLNFTFADNTRLETHWWAVYRHISDTGPLSTAGDFFNYFVLGLAPDFDPNLHWWPQEDNFYENSTWDDDDFDALREWNCDNPKPNWCNESLGAYPDDPIVVQTDLHITGAGIVTGYLLDDIKTGVLSIPSFLQYGENVLNFNVAVTEFIGNATERGTEHVIIDLQQNDGGDVLLALTTFSQFFSGIKPYTGSRIRNHEFANILGTAYTEWWKNLAEEGNNPNKTYYEAFADSEWIIAHHINAATGANFSSWSEYSRPFLDRGDNFSQTQLYDLSNKIFDEATFGWVPNAYIEPDVPAAPPIWASSDIVILTDGLCSSACAYFVELMSHQAGVRTIAVGGRPSVGPMQTASGNRGARLYSANDLILDYSWLNDTVNDKDAYSRLPPPSIWEDTGMQVSDASFNIRDVIRQNDTIPLQFIYDAAQCRIYYTLENVYNMSRLWRDAATATWSDPSLCVQNSTGYAQGPNMTSTKSPPERTAQVSTLELGEIDDVDFYINSTSGLVAARAWADASNRNLEKCSKTGCGQSFVCQTLPVSCLSGGKLQAPTVKLCVPRCSNAGACNCQPTGPADSKRFTPKPSPKKGNEMLKIYEGFCVPGTIDPVQYGVSCS
ncbi:hypothetical protein BCR34DRAFT_490455 [Clohesyomyces aquaticus]|uniref:CPAF-like PDZ domain-containing protein n=1 Tax=Clohesyomyces aquaticus TaxID=1231657 RepID=A0A1Y1Z6Y2_9PLEO|nr:hypothetical protein BCR34DRAFT_490455 [Clohesyomyces aquaticus]